MGVFHPKTIAFFVAFAPQFISFKSNYAGQASILVATFGLVLGCTDTLYALAAARMSQLLKAAGRRALVKASGWRRADRSRFCDCGRTELASGDGPGVDA